MHDGKSRSFFIPVIILMISVPLSIYIPVRQAAEFRADRFASGELEQNIEEKLEENRELVGEIAVLLNPDHIVEQSAAGKEGLLSTEDDVIIIRER